MSLGKKVIAQDSLPHKLKSVTVTSKKSPLTESARGAALDLSHLKEAKFWTLADALRQIPGLEINAEQGIVRYMGKDVSIQRNGVSVAGFQKQILSTLNSVTAKSYSKIELNLFDLKTEKPTLSFVLPEYPEGYYGNASTMLGTNINSVSTSVSLSKKKHLFNLSANGMLMLMPKTKSNSTTNYLQTGIIETRSRQTNNFNTKQYGFSISDCYSITPRHILNISAGYNAQSSKYEMLMKQNRFHTDTLINNADISFSTKSPFRQNPSLSTNISYTYKLKATDMATQRLDISFEYENSKNHSLQNADAETFAPNAIYQNKNNQKNSNLFSLIGYEYKHKNWGTFEGVVKYFHRYQYQNFDYTYQTNAVGKDSTILQYNNITYQYGALLVCWDKQFKPFSARIVLKEDYRHDVIHNKLGQDKISFHSFSPYLSLFKRIKSTSLRIEAQYAQRHPELSIMSDIVQYGGQYSITGMQTRGNSVLKPAKTFSLNAMVNTSVKRIGIIATGKYSHTAHPINSYNLADDTLMVRTYRNLKSTNTYSGNVSFNFYLFPRFTAQLSSSINASHYYVNTDTTSNGTLWNESVRFAYTVTPALRLNIGFNYNGGSSFQSKMPARLNSNFSCMYIKESLLFHLEQAIFTNPISPTKVLFMAVATKCTALVELGYLEVG